ncbi:cytochrome b/b6 domain-containing protein [Pseudomonas silvicola]|nr:cytochrome b/b6 domain-containing protein [Pseudomonas silvicola]
MASKIYSPAQVLLHWLSAAFILWALVMGFSVMLLDVTPGFKAAIAGLNVSLSILFIPVFALRTWLRLAHLRRYGHRPGEQLAGVIHNVIYAVTALVLLTGVLMMNRPIQVFDWLTLPQPILDPEWDHRFHTLHAGCNVLLGLLVALHVLAVVKHEAVGKPVLRRMLVTR